VSSPEQTDTFRTGPLRIGLTGGIASGKTLVADTFSELGVPVIDTDVIAREVAEPGQPALQEIADRFGADVLDASGQLDRAALRQHVFSSPAEREALEAILHPRIRSTALDRMQKTNAAYVVVVVPLLFESGFIELVDRALVIDADSETRIERILERDGGSREQAEQIIASQMDDAGRLARADDVIENHGDPAETRAAVARLHEQFLSIAAAR